MKRVAAAVALLGLAASLYSLAVFFGSAGLDPADKLASVFALFLGVVAVLQKPVRRMIGILFAGPRSRSDLSVTETLHILSEAQNKYWFEHPALRAASDPHLMPIPLLVHDENGRSSSTQFREALQMYQESSRRLAVVGPPGSGKTILALQLAHHLNQSRAGDDLLPVWLTASAWNPVTETLNDFIEHMIVHAFPGLSAYARTLDGSDASLAEQLVRSGRLLPVLDGLDELPRESQVAVLRRLNEVGSGYPLILTWRSEDYNASVSAVGRGLSRCVRVELQPVTVAAAMRYLREGTSVHPDGRWDAVARSLTEDPQSPLEIVLTNPFFLFLARSVYETPERNPVEMLTASGPSSTARIKDLLFDGFLVTAFADSKTWTAQQAQRWLTFLARHLTIVNSNEFEWWMLKRSVPLPVLGILGGLPFGLPVGLAVGVGVGAVYGPIPATVYGLLVGAGISLTGGLPGMARSWRRQSPSRLGLRLTGNFLRLVAALLFGAVAGLAIMLLGAVFLGWQAGAAFGGGVGSTVALALGVRQVLEARSGIVTLTTPELTLRDDRTAAIGQAVAGGIALAIGVSIAVQAASRLGAALGIAVGVLSGLIYGLAFSSARSNPPSWYPFTVARIYLALRGHLPLRLMFFLSEAHARTILRQSGPVYSFRNADFQRRLAEA